MLRSRPVACRRQTVLGLLLGAVAGGAASAAALVGREARAGAVRQPLLISYNDDYAPYSFVDPQLHPQRVQGILPDLLQALLKDLDSVQLEALGLPWRRAQAMVKLGQADGLCTFASDERRQYALFNELPLVELRPHLFFSARHPQRAQLERLRSREDLKAFHLVDQKGNQWAEQVLADFPHVEWTMGHDAVFRMVLAARGDVHVSLSPLVTQWRLKKLAIQAQVMSIPAPYLAANVPFHLGLRQDFPDARQILAHLDRRLAQAGSAALIESIVRPYHSATSS
ncbi:hypothetical protein C1O66_20180 [Paucibacter aquatile]|uniref:Solute-binding protein family 3/N-terminal domain-containing protein n=1 Tax=Kinneretia aquatilis TaxID=2070761 RepID=A0A2N8KRH9_9BURK|nr:transporter substrate-binding domain-containing protein [Paucibacter aquatile]PND36056.1 hypothetical protein C1O66_20180 [Paucibacter aquatile]